MRHRIIEDELLDALEYRDPLSHCIHRDIHRYNCLLGNYRWVADQLSQKGNHGQNLLEIGAGHGRLITQLHQRGLLRGYNRVTAMDAICERPKGLDASIDWCVDSTERFDDYEDYSVIVCSNFLHQLHAPALAELGRKLKNARVIIAAETRRSTIAYGLCHLSRIIGFSRLGIGDGLKSLRAGFRNNELAQLLELDPQQWTSHTNESFLGAYHFVASRTKNA